MIDTSLDTTTDPVLRIVFLPYSDIETSTLLVKVGFSTSSSDMMKPLQNMTVLRHKKNKDKFASSTNIGGEVLVRTIGTTTLRQQTSEKTNKTLFSLGAETELRAKIF